MVQIPESIREQLRGFVVPEAPSMWPLAQGWWLLGLAALIALVFVFIHRRKRRRWLHVWTQWRDAPGTDEEKLQNLAVLIRRVALKCAPRHTVAAHSGENWLNCLDKLSEKPVFAGEFRQWLAHGQYQRKTQAPIETLLTDAGEQARRWILIVETRHRRGRIT